MHTNPASVISAFAPPAHSRFKLWLGALLTGCMVFLAVLYLFWQPWPADAFNLAAKLQGPSINHWLGTDVYGRDMTSMLMGGARNALWVAISSVCIGLLAGVGLGIIAAFNPGKVDLIVMRFTDFTFAFPAILLAIMLIAIYGPGMTNAIIAIGIANIAVFTRLTRNMVRALLPRDFVLAARALGRSTWGIVYAHILPNILSAIIVQASIQLSMAVLAEAALTYLGLGVQPPEPSWGRMLSEAQTLLFDAPALAIMPGIAIAITVLGFNQLGDGLRDWLDPRSNTTRAVWR